jgi:hypothetical protein
MNDVVYAHLVKMHADASLRLRRLEARERTVPVLSGTSRGRLSLSRQIREARDQAKSWGVVVSAALYAGLDELEVDERSVPGE